MRILLLVNPRASSVSAHTQVSVRRILGERHEIDMDLTDERDHATELARKAAKEDYEAVVVLGGDGTLNEVANGLLGSDTALAVLPGGSTNVFARTIGLEEKPVAATRQVVESLEAGRVSRIGLGEANGRAFLFNLGMGFDASVVEQIERRANLKRWLRHSIFVYKALGTWLYRVDKKNFGFEVLIPGAGDSSEFERIPSFFTMCLNTDPYTYIGSRPLNFAEGDADLNSRLTAVSLNSVSAGSIFSIMRSALAAGKSTDSKSAGGDSHRRHSRAGDSHRHRPSVKDNKSVDYRADLDHFVVRTLGEPFPWQVDGDYIGRLDELHVRHIPDTLMLVQPNIKGQTEQQNLFGQ